MTAYYLPDEDGKPTDVFLFQGDRYIDQVERVQTYNKVMAEQTEEDQKKFHHQQKKVREFCQYVEAHQVPQMGTMEILKDENIGRWKDGNIEILKDGNIEILKDGNIEILKDEEDDEVVIPPPKMEEYNETDILREVEGRAESLEAEAVSDMELRELLAEEETEEEMLRRAIDMI